MTKNHTNHTQAYEDAVIRNVARPHDADREGDTIYRATVSDLINREQIGRFTYSADNIEEARERGWRIAGSRFGNGIDVRIERLSK